MRFVVLTLLMFGALGGCVPHHARQPSVTIAPAEPGETSNDWRRVVQGDDRLRLDTLPMRFTATLATVRTPASRRLARSEATLLGAAVAAWPAPSPGVYRCRTVRVSSSGGAVTLAAYKPFFCFVQIDGALLTFIKGTGTERPGGRLWPDGDRRFVFLGGVPLQPGANPAPYGAGTTDRIAILERIADFRWRLIVDTPQPGVAFDVLDLWPDSGSLP